MEDPPTPPATVSEPAAVDDGIVPAATVATPAAPSSPPPSTSVNGGTSSVATTGTTSIDATGSSTTIADATTPTLNPTATKAAPPPPSNGTSSASARDAPATPDEPSTVAICPLSPDATSPVTDSVLRAAKDTAHALASPNAFLKPRKDFFDLVLLAAEKEKPGESKRLDTVKARLAADATLACSRAVHLAPKVKDGYTPLHAACEFGNVAVVETLLGVPEVSSWARDLQVCWKRAGRNENEKMRGTTRV